MVRRGCLTAASEREGEAPGWEGDAIWLKGFSKFCVAEKFAQYACDVSFGQFGGLCATS